MLQKLKTLISPKAKAIAQMQEPQALPMGMAEFEVWSDRIIALAMITADVHSQKFVLADLVTHLDATQDHMPDGYFVKVLRKIAANEIANAKRTEHRDLGKAKNAAKAAQQDVEVTTTEVVSPDVLENPKV